MRSIAHVRICGGRGQATALGYPTLCQLLRQSPADKPHSWLAEYIIPFLGIIVSIPVMPGIVS